MGGGPAKDKALFALPWAEPKETIARIRQKFPDLDITYLDIRADKQSSSWTFKYIDPEIFKDKTIIITFNSFPPKPEDGPKLDWIHVTSAGTNHMTKHPIYTDSDVTLTTSSGIHGPQISEWVISTALAFSHHHNTYYEQQKKSEWKKDRIESVRDFAGQKVGILGYGSIGRQVGRVAKAMGMDVVAFTASPRDTPEKRADNGYIVPNTGDPDGSIPSAWYSGLDKKNLHNFLSQDLDWVVLSVPLTKDTFHFIGREELSILSKRKAFLSNISRGDIINQPDLIAALEAGDLRGAALDVASPEPLPSDDPLWKAPNLTITPHVSGNSVDYIDRALGVFEMNMALRAKGEPLVNVVDRRRGY